MDIPPDATEEAPELLLEEYQDEVAPWAVVAALLSLPYEFHQLVELLLAVAVPLLLLGYR